MFILAVLATRWASGYSVLAHESIIDSVWDQQIRQVLLKRFPGTGADGILKARAHAYGGCIIQDMGYYPLGSHLFSDLVHYVRSGDFVEVLISEAQDVNEYAFALGALAHYAADNTGHPLATNLSVPLLYPKQRAKFGNVMTYAQYPAGHLQTEFAFDVLQVARGLYTPEAYHSFIGFEVAKPLLERAFLKTYGFELKDAFTNLDLAIGTYRFTIASVVPQMTKVALATREKQIKENMPQFDRKKFAFSLAKKQYDKEFGSTYRKPGWFARFLSWVFRVVPKVGPFKALAFHSPTPQVEKLFIESFDKTVKIYSELLAGASTGKLQLKNTNFDTGGPVVPGNYELADNAYAELARKLASQKDGPGNAEMLANILEFYRDMSRPFATKKHEKEWRNTVSALEKLKAAPRGSAISNRPDPRSLTAVPSVAAAQYR
ncbi:MAG TPA: zinc dependent phospholipase C family protein [Bryobacteraceae bacterium]|nr:zinc dependent phospholipase C family protein [Bryobacteraceae bacterium]